MANWLYYDLDVLASNQTEMKQIAERLNQPSPELASWLAEKWSQPVSEVTEDLKELIAFKATKNLGYVDPDVNQARRFRASFSTKCRGIIRSHLFEVSEIFPTAILLLEYFDPQMSYAGREVIRAARVVEAVFDGDQQAQAVNWALPDIFAPFRTEYEAKLEFGSLWNQWLKAQRREIERLWDPIGFGEDPPSL
jgi:hypothetical protein